VSGRLTTGYHARVKWLLVAVIFGFVGLRLWAHLRPESKMARFGRRRVLLRTDAEAMSRRELLLSALSFLAFGAAAVGLYAGVVWGAAELGWGVFEARPVVVLGKAGLFVGVLALATSLYLAGAALVCSRRRRSDAS
jgi:hypothetical protein